MIKPVIDYKGACTRPSLKIQFWQLQANPVTTDSITFALLSQEAANWQTYSQVAESFTGTGVKVSVQKLGAASHSIYDRLSWTYNAHWHTIAAQMAVYTESWNHSQCLIKADESAICSEWKHTNIQERMQKADTSCQCGAHSVSSILYCYI